MWKQLLAGFLTLVATFVALVSQTDDIHTRGMYLAAAIVVLHQWLMLGMFIVWSKTKTLPRMGLTSGTRCCNGEDA